MIKRMFRRNSSVLFLVLSAILVFTGGAGAQTSAKPSDILVIDATRRRPILSRISGSTCSDPGRASLSLRESYRHDLRQVKQVTDMEFVRFHAIFLMTWASTMRTARAILSITSPTSTRPMTACLQNGVRPFVELSFMPKKLASRDAPHAFWYKQNVAPPKDWA